MAVVEDVSQSQKVNVGLSAVQRLGRLSKNARVADRYSQVF